MYEPPFICNFYFCPLCVYSELLLLPLSLFKFVSFLLPSNLKKKLPAPGQCGVSSTLMQQK